jgi:hypothetical protein
VGPRAALEVRGRVTRFWRAARLATVVLAVAGSLAAQQTTPSAKPFRVVRPSFHQLEDGPATTARPFFIPGETVFFRCEVQGYTLTKERAVSLSFELEPVDAQGIALTPPHRGKIDSTLSAQDKNWLPVVRHSFVVPPYALSGEYRVRILVKDENAGVETKTDAAFAVQGRGIQPSQGLSLQNFGFYRGENETEPLRVAAYRAGDTLWARFDVTGYQIGEQNAVHISYGISITNAQGRVLYRQDPPTVDQSTSFYPKRYVSCLLNLNIQPDTPPQEFALVITVTDHIGNQTQQSSHRFRVE